MNGLVVALLVAGAGGVGAGLRYVVDNSLPQRLRDRFPWGTLTVNLSGSFVLGLLTGLALDSAWSAVLATGLLGGYTTFSTASVESVQLLIDKRYLAAFTYGVGVLAAGIALAVTGILITR